MRRSSNAPGRLLHPLPRRRILPWCWAPSALSRVLSESLLLCILAAALGLAAAALIFPLTAALGLEGASLPLNVVAAGIAAAVVLALVSGLPPARRARRLAIADALIDR